MVGSGPSPGERGLVATSEILYLCQDGTQETVTYGAKYEGGKEMAGVHFRPTPAIRYDLALHRNSSDDCRTGSRRGARPGWVLPP